MPRGGGGVPKGVSPIGNYCFGYVCTRLTTLTPDTYHLILSHLVSYLTRRSKRPRPRLLLLLPPPLHPPSTPASRLARLSTSRRPWWRSQSMSGPPGGEEGGYSNQRLAFPERILLWENKKQNDLWFDKQSRLIDLSAAVQVCTVLMKKSRQFPPSSYGGNRHHRNAAKQDTKSTTTNNKTKSCPKRRQTRPIHLPTRLGCDARESSIVANILLGS